MSKTRNWAKHDVITQTTAPWEQCKILKKHTLLSLCGAAPRNHFICGVTFEPTMFASTQLRSHLHRDDGWRSRLRVVVVVTGHNSFSVRNNNYIACVRYSVACVMHSVAGVTCSVTWVTCDVRVTRDERLACNLTWRVDTCVVDRHV